MRRTAFMLAVLLLAVPNLFAAEASAGLSSATVSIGDTVRLTIRASGVGSGSVFIPPPDGEGLGLLDVDSSRFKAASEMGFVIALYDTGTHDLGPFPVIVHAGAAAETLFTQQLSLSVRSVAPDTAASILPIKSYREHPFQWRELYTWWWIPALMAAGLIGYWLWKRYRKRVVIGDEPAIPLLPPHDEAVRALIALRDQKYPARGMLMEFFTEYSHIMRRYLERTFEFPALEMTTFDLSAELSDSRYAEDLSRRLLPIFMEADLVKFAKHVPDFRQCDSYVDLGFQIVELTKPKPESDPAEAKAA